LPHPDTIGRNEIDSLAETSCAGVNWIPLFYTGETVTVYGFKGNEADQSVPLATCATKIVTVNGQVYILICPQMLYYGTQLPRSLINPNQLRAAGTIVHDNPATDREDEFGLITENLYIPFQTAGATIYFESLAPTYDEVEEYRHQVLGPNEWNPTNVTLRSCPLSESRAVEIAALRAGNQVPFSELCIDSRAVELKEEV